MNPEKPTPQFSTPQEEIAFLQQKIAQKENELVESENLSRQDIVAQEIRGYQEQESNKLLTPEYQMKVEEIEDKKLHLTPEHNQAIDDLIILMEEKGIKNALEVVVSLENPHLEDDFHRFLVQYFVELGTAPGIKEGTPLFKALRMRLFEITLLRVSATGEDRKFADLVAGMEQFYAGMMSISQAERVPKPGEDYFVLELAQASSEEDVVFYCSVPRAKERLLEKQLLSIFPDARITEHKEDYNPFNDQGHTLGSYAVSTDTPVLPLKTYENFEQDPLNVILNAFSKLKKEGEGAAIQFVLSPVRDVYNKKYALALDKVREGATLKVATESATATVAKEVGGALKGLVFGYKDEIKKEEKPDTSLKVGDEVVNNLIEKTTSPILETNIRIVTSASKAADAEVILSEVEAAFNQFAKPGANSLAFERLEGKKLERMLHSFSFRLYDGDQSLPLNIKELTTLFHFPVSTVNVSELKEEKAKQASAPSSVAGDGIVMGINKHQGEEKKVHFKREDRVRHCYVIGQTGTGKTTLLKNMIVQDIANGDGVCMIDPHGTDIADILANIPADRVDDVIYFDPAHTARPMGLNMLEYDVNFPEQKTFVVNELFSIFQKLYSAESMGPMFEQYFRNATMLVIEDPSTGNTLLDVSRVMSDEKYRELKLSRCNNPLVVQFWRKTAGEAGGEAALANMVPYITSKFDVFLANDIMRPIIAQEKSSFNFREVMDEKKILLVNLSKGRLGDINSNLIGLIIVGKILMASLSRVDSENRNDFYLYIDEFQNVTTDSISTILSEARKYRLGLNIAHQYIAQIPDNIRDAVFGNVGSMAVFRVGSDDAEFLEKQYAPTFTAQDIIGLENRNAYLKLLIDGQPNDPFNIATLKPEEGNRAIIEKVKELSYLKYGRERTEVETEIMKKFS